MLPVETVTVQPWFIPYAGKYVFHCHALEHGDKAMAPETSVTFDRSKPGLAALSARRVAKGAARVRFKVSEESELSVAFKRRGRTVKSAVASGTGTRGVTVRGLRAGRYAIQVRATDIAGNRSKLRTLRLTVR